LWRGDALKVSKHPSERAAVIHTFGVRATMTIVPSNLGILVSGLFLGERFFSSRGGQASPQPVRRPETGVVEQSAG
jgi:hypothetical protein